MSTEKTALSPPGREPLAEPARTDTAGSTAAVRTISKYFVRLKKRSPGFAIGKARRNGLVGPAVGVAFKKEALPKLPAGTNGYDFRPAHQVVSSCRTRLASIRPLDDPEFRSRTRETTISVATSASSPGPRSQQSTAARMIPQVDFFQSPSSRFPIIPRRRGLWPGSKVRRDG